MEVKVRNKTASVCIFMKESILDELIISVNKEFETSKIFCLESFISIDDIKQIINGKKVIFFGGGFCNYYDDIMRLVSIGTFILKEDDIKPLCDKYEGRCEVRNWNIYWSSLPAFHSSTICSTIYTYFNSFPNVRERQIFRGLISYGFFEFSTKDKIEFISNPPRIDELVSEGIKSIDNDFNIFEKRNRQSREVLLDIPNVIERIHARVTFGDLPIRETLYHLYSQFCNVQPSAAILIDPILSEKEMLVKVYIVSQSREISAISIAKIFNTTYSGNSTFCSCFCNMNKVMKIIS